MCARRNPHPVPELPVVQSFAQARAHDPEHAALVPVPGHLVRPLVMLLLQLRDATPRGRLAHALELQLCGLAEDDSSLLRAGFKKAEEVLPSIARTPDQVLATLVSEEAIHALLIDAPEAEPELLGWHDPVIALGGGEEDQQPATCRTPQGKVIELDAPVLRTREDLLMHDSNQPAFIRIPAELIAGVWWIIQYRYDRSQVGEVARGLETCLVGWGELELGETDTGSLIVQGLRQAAQGCNQLIELARQVQGRLFAGPVRPSSDGQPDEH